MNLILKLKAKVAVKIPKLKFGRLLARESLETAIFTNQCVLIWTSQGQNYFRMMSLHYKYVV